ncbi:MAG: DUF4139 domain-containing protein [Deltaproteobacteria bacterium]|nr:DUF4139 domain-containing protein [Deltaproteobacteria bacterium]
MYRLCLVVYLMGSIASVANAAETEVKSKITSVGLFKNGLAVVNRTVSVPSSGTYRIEDVPEPVHGTFWIESDAKVVTRLTRRIVDLPADKSAATDLQAELSGRDVVIHFIDGRIPAASGRVVALAPVKGEGSWNRNYQSTYYGGFNPAQPPHKRFLVLENGKGRTFIDSAQIAYLHVQGTQGTIKRQKPVLLFEVSGLKKKPATIRISYLAKGMAWAPSYRIDISKSKTLSLVQKAVIKNELETIEKAELKLISGFPSVEFAHVTSPMSLRNNWQSFFAQLNNPVRTPSHVSLGNVVTQQRVSFNEPSPRQSWDLSAIPTGDGVDLHYQNIGRHSLDEGDSLVIQTAAAKAGYERIVEWIVPDTRGVNGQFIQDYQRTQNPDKYEDAAWDAIRFRNPLGFPMTTAPAMVVDGGRFNGQAMSYWVNRGEQTTLRITKALSLRTLHLQQEIKGKRKDVWLGGDRYYRTSIKGELRVNNHRKETVNLMIQRRFSGNLIKAERSPKCSLMEKGVYSVNKRNQCNWNLKLKPGQEIKLNYSYNVLVRY